MNKQEIIEEAKRVISEEAESMLNANRLIGDDFYKAVSLIQSSNKVIVTGVGKSGMIAKKIAATLSSVGVSSVYLHPVDALHGDIGLVQSGDTVILLSKSGSTEEIVRLVPHIKTRNASIIAIVGNTKSFLSRSADAVIDATVQKEACPLNLAPTSSSIVALALGDALAMAVMKANNFTVEDFSKLHPLGQLGRNLTVKIGDIMHSGDSLPIINQNSFFRDAVIEIGNKGLGCVCVIDESGFLKGIITDGDIRRVLSRGLDIRELKTENAMTSNPVRISQDKYLGEAISLMENRSSQISVLPVVDSANMCIGVVRIHDIIRSGM